MRELRDDFIRILTGGATIAVANLNAVEQWLHIVGSALGIVLCIIGIVTGWRKFIATLRGKL